VDGATAIVSRFLSCSPPAPPVRGPLQQAQAQSAGGLAEEEEEEEAGGEAADRAQG
jgi:hypothetical protein